MAVSACRRDDPRSSRFRPDGRQGGHVRALRRDRAQHDFLGTPVERPRGGDAAQRDPPRAELSQDEIGRGAPESERGRLLDEPRLLHRQRVLALGNLREPALDRLEEDGVIRQVTSRQRNRVWGVVDLLAELDGLAARIAASVRAAD